MIYTKKSRTSFQCLFNKVADHTSIIEVHTRTVRVEDTDNSHLEQDKEYHMEKQEEVNIVLSM